MKKIISLNLSSNDPLAPQPTITGDELTWLRTNFYFFNAAFDFFLSGGMIGIEGKNDGSYSITDPSLAPAIHNLLLIKDHSFDTLIGELEVDEKLPYISLLIDFSPVPELDESILTYLLYWVRGPQKIFPMNQLSETNQTMLTRIFQHDQIASDVINNL